MNLAPCAFRPLPERFRQFYYLFSHEDSRDAFSIPHDLKILKEVFTLEPGGYNRDNAFWHSHSIPKMVASLPDADRHRLGKRLDAIFAKYDELSGTYQASKDGNAIPLN